MQVTVQPKAVTLPPMVKPYRPGVEARDAILRELRRREDAGEPTTVRAIALALGMKRSTAALHMATLRDAGLVMAHPGRIGRHELTLAGRIATDTHLTNMD